MIKGVHRKYWNEKEEIYLIIHVELPKLKINNVEIKS